ncbi:MAG: hypothetical protein KDK97_06020 [Verrucomicrobiales bacterium]|nr:hypothetical protein [Verrucomicrobiales bacterium]MCP5558070.1 hypothetical protein [Verrucomicrobiaceae bacterium]
MRNFSRNFLRLLEVGTFLAVMNGTVAHAQYGASPSQTSLFFDDLRNRSIQTAPAGAGVRGGEAEYDYDRGVYTGTSEDRDMGERMTSAQARAAQREMGQPTVRSGSAAFAARSAGDYTNYSGQYSAPNTFFAPTYVSDPYLQGRRNLRLGGVNVGFGLYGGVEYNDNVTRAHEDPQSDIIGTLMLNIDANYQVTKNNRLTLTTAIGVDHYFNHPDLSPYGNDLVLNVLPGSALAFDMKIGPVFVVLYDRVSVRPAVRNEFALSSNQIFGVFQNDAGMAAMWAINSDLSLSINYMHSNAIAMEDQFAIFDRNTDSVHGTLAWSPDHTWTLGLEGGVTFTTYPEGFNNDGTLLNAGLFFSTPIGNSTFLRIGAGYQSFSFDAPPEIKVSESDVLAADRTVTQYGNLIANLTQRRDDLARSGGDTTSLDRQIEKAVADQVTAQTIAGQRRTSRENALNANTQDANDLDDYYYNVTVSNQLNARVSQVLSFGHESSLNNISNFITADYVTYGVGYAAWRGGIVSASGYFEDAKMSGGRQAEDLTQYGMDVYVSHQLNSRIRLGAGYHWGQTDSSVQNIEYWRSIDPSLPSRDFTQQAFSFDISYALSRKFNIGLGYRYFMTDADSDLNDFDQSRIIFAGTYNF